MPWAARLKAVPLTSDFSPNELAIRWRIKGEYATIRNMARRPNLQANEVMSREELSKLRDQLSHSGLEVLRHAYHTAYARCRMVNDIPPSARSIQELVQMWKQLWRRLGHGPKS